MLSRHAVVGVGLLGALLACPKTGSAQGPATEGAVFLLIPLGARAVSLGESVAATRLGAEGALWNPASLAWATSRELVYDHVGETFVLPSADVLSFVLPAGRAGSVGGAVRYFNFGDQEATDPFGTVIGTLYSRATVLTGSYAATFGQRVAAGVSAHWVRQGDSCGGSCPGAHTFSVSTTAFDVGVQAADVRATGITLAASIRNLGFGLQVNDAEQTDPLPTRLHLGASYRVARAGQWRSGLAMSVSGEVVTLKTFTSPSLRLGTEFALSNVLMVRLGTAIRAPVGAPWGSAGIGVRRGRLGLDFARTIGGSAADAGTPPTYVSLRVGFGR